MSQLFFMFIVKDFESFIAKVEKLAHQPGAKLFHCYLVDDLFIVATERRVQKFNFSNYEDDKQIIAHIQKAIDLLLIALPRQYLLFDNITLEKVNL